MAGRADAWPLAYETSLSAPELPLREVGLGVTAPATLEHFVGYPAVAFTARKESTMSNAAAVVRAGSTPRPALRLRHQKISNQSVNEWSHPREANRAEPR